MAFAKQSFALRTEEARGAGHGNSGTFKQLADTSAIGRFAEAENIIDCVFILTSEFWLLTSVTSVQWHG